MNCFRILDSGVAAERKIWHELYEKLPGKEVQAHPSYVELFAGSNHRSVCATWHDSNGTILFPFIIRPFIGEPWAGSESDAADIITPYGYGGPYIWGCPNHQEFWSSFEQWANVHKVVSLFARLSLFPEQLAPFAGEVAEKSVNIVRTLDLEPETIWMDYSHKVRKNVKKALRCGLHVETDYCGARLEEFLEIYHSTLDRRQALSGYYFERDFFEAILRELPEQAVFFHTLQDDKVISTELVLVSDQHIYSFLGGTIASSYELRPNDLLKHEIILWGHAAGKKAYILGGGYEGQDGIFQYKKSFAPSGEVIFKVGKRIFDSERYARLVQRRHSSAVPVNNDDSYFPAYRA